MLWNQGAVHKEWRKPEILDSCNKCNDLWPSQEPRRLRSRFIGIWKVCIHPFVSFFQVQRCFIRSFSHNAHAEQLTSVTYDEKNAQTSPIIELQFFTCMNCIPSIIFHRQRALSITGNRRRYVSRPNNSCKEDNVKRGTDAFYFCAEDF